MNDSRSPWISSRGPAITTELTLAAFGNTRSYGGGMLFCPNADRADWLLDITKVHSASRT
jgi:diacylglycerol kinase (ATP)